MKISIDDPDHWEKCAFRPEGAEHIRVLLDGVELDNVISANEEAGEVTRYRIIISGHIYALNGFFQTETLHGKVQIIMPDWWPK